MEGLSIFRAADNIEYAAGAIVSKTIIKKPTGSVTLFAFAEGEALSEHSSPHDALVQILEGNVEITVGGKQNILHAEESIILPSNIPHALKAVKRFKMLLTMIKS